MSKLKDQADVVVPLGPKKGKTDKKPVKRGSITIRHLFSLPSLALPSPISFFHYSHAKTYLFRYRIQ